MVTDVIPFNHREQHFTAQSSLDVGTLVGGMKRPLSLTFQLTRGCNLKCIYCSEPPGIRTSTLDRYKAILDDLAGTRRVIFSGGEPMLYKKFWEVLEYARERFELVVLSTNATLIDHNAAVRLKELVDYIDITVDGPRKQHNFIRGNYDLVTRGAMNVALAGIPLSIICVYLPENKDAIRYICQTGDALGAIKVKILTPIPKGRSVDLFDGFIPTLELQELAEDLQKEKAKNGWNIRITITDWRDVGQGHCIIMEPDGRLVATPVWDDETCVRSFGRLGSESMAEAWSRYEFKTNHIRKYLEQSLIVV